MAKIIAWLIVVFIVLLALRLVNFRNARARREREEAKQAAVPKAKGGVPMVRCIRCGIYLPQTEARSVRGGYACVAGECASHA
jgi:uncharacterized protein YpmB